MVEAGLLLSSSSSVISTLTHVRLPFARPRAAMDAQIQTHEPDERRRVIVCGGGVIGVCTAYFLAKKGACVTLLERSTDVACAASGKAGGFLALDWCDGGPLSDLARTSFQLHRSLASQLNGPQAYGYRPLHALSLSLDEIPNNQKKKPFHSLPPWIDVPPKTPPRTIGTLETTAQVHPQLFTRTLLSAAVDKYGAEVHFGEQVVGIQVIDGHLHGVINKEGRVFTADAVVLALGPWSSNLSFLSSLFNVSGLKAHSIVLRPQNPQAITPHALFLRYTTQDGKHLDPEVYPRPTGEVYLCGMSEQVELPDNPEEVTANEESIRVLHRVAETVSMEHLGRGKARVEMEQACFLPCTDDGRPIIGKVPNVEGAYVGTGHSCWGILNGPATGAALAELVLDGHATIVDLSPFDPSRFLS